MGSTHTWIVELHYNFFLQGGGVVSWPRLGSRRATVSRHIQISTPTYQTSQHPARFVRVAAYIFKCDQTNKRMFVAYSSTPCLKSQTQTQTQYRPQQECQSVDPTQSTPAPHDLMYCVCTSRIVFLVTPSILRVLPEVSVPFET